MRPLWVVFKKEFWGYFRSPLAYIFAVAFLLVANGLYLNTFFLARVCDLRALFELLPLLLLVFVSALTMRLWAEERRGETLGLLLSFPFSPAYTVLGKFLGALVFGTVVLAGTLVLPLMLSLLGDPDGGALVAGYLGILLLLAFYVALGQFVSGLFTEQIAAFVVTAVAGLGAYLLGTDLVSSSLESWLPGVGGFLREALGLGPHLAPFFKGVVPLSGVLFFLVYVGIFLLLNHFTVAYYLRYARRPLLAPTVLLLLLCGLFAGALLSEVRLPRLDLTEEKLYTLSPVTRKVLARLEGPLRITYYVSAREKLPPMMRNLSQEVRALLEELQAVNPRVRYAVVDPERDPDLARKLRDRGIEPFAVQTVERDRVSLRRVYSALALSYLDQPEEVIPQVVPDSLSTLEYDLVSRIYKLTLKEKPVVAIFEPPGAFGRPTYETARRILEELGFEVKGTPLTRENPLPKKARLLVIFSPGKLNDRQLFEIGRFLHRGGAVLLAASAARFSYHSAPDGRILATPLAEDLSVNKLLEEYGLVLKKAILCDEQRVTMAVSQERELGIFRALVHVPVNFPMQVQVLSSQMNRRLPVTHGLDALLFLWGSPLKVERARLKEEGLRLLPLFYSSPKAWTEKVELGAFSEEDFRPPAKRQRYLLAALVEGKFPLPFGGKAPPWPGKKSSKGKGDPSRQKSGEVAKPGKLVVVGSGAMFADGLIEIFDNALFLANLSEALGLSGDLLALRARLRPVRYIREVATGEKLFWRLFSLGVPSLFWALWGGVFFWYRRRSRERSMGGRT
ncbi:hypothetical protein FVE67_07855 [Thermosulfurimonas marina]|uniref:Uncharacterized protein n=1 Tax=Thermosulfurimonas marina TaxID=2047767 RepID=A0A6H1WU60_9BACT|nr:Gldg family protein [Thermosulfurimonas marina]QJA06711.1 hypothetical protein FVE67_07855 [Thermosulfurimonas marina]